MVRMVSGVFPRTIRIVVVAMVTTVVIVVVFVAVVGEGITGLSSFVVGQLWGEAKILEQSEEVHPFHAHHDKMDHALQRRRGEVLQPIKR